MKLKKEWNRSVLPSKPELHKSKLKEKFKLEHTKLIKRELDWKEKHRSNLPDLREKNKCKLIILSKRLPRLSTSRELSLRKLIVKLKCSSIKKSLSLEELREMLKSPVIKLNKKLGMLKLELNRKKEKLISKLKWI